MFSTEALSLLGTQDEVKALKSLFPDGDEKFTIILVLREKADWLASYINQALKEGVTPSYDPDSPNYVGDNSWLVDFETLIEAYRSVFDDVILLEYNKTDIVDQIGKSMGVNFEFDTSAYRRNISPRFPRLMRFPRILTRRLIGSEDGGMRRVFRNIRERRRR